MTSYQRFLAGLLVLVVGLVTIGVVLHYVG